MEIFAGLQHNASAQESALTSGLKNACNSGANEDQVMLTRCT